MIRPLEHPLSPPEHHPSHKSEPAADCTRARILGAAGQVFAEHGFNDATVREICTRAGANIASINYYFRNKDALYLEVIDFAQQCVHAERPIRIDPAAPPQERLRLFIRHFVARVLDPGNPAWHSKLMLREMIEPTPALDRVVSNMIRPTFLVLRSILEDLVPGITEAQVRLCSTSVIGQVLMHRHCEPVTKRLFPDHVWTTAELDKLAEHVWRFSLAGIASIAAAPAPKPPQPTRRPTPSKSARTPRRAR